MRPYRSLMFAPIAAALLFAGFGRAGAQTAVHSDYEPHALELLQQMAQAYTQLTSLKQETEFASSMTPIQPPPAGSPGTRVSSEPSPKPKVSLIDKDKEPDMRSQLLFQRPNLLLFETRKPSTVTGRTTVSQWVSDGRDFWSYNGEKNTYTKEKAQGRLRDFARLKNLSMGCLELLMMMGTNPFADVQRSVDSVRCDGSEEVRGVPTDVVLLKAISDAQILEVRLYIGKTDFLLRRFVVDTTPITSADTPGKIGDPLDELIDAAPAPKKGEAPAEGPDSLSGDSSVLPVKTRFGYENTITPSPRFDPATFQFGVPKDASIYTPIEDVEQASKTTYKNYLRGFVKSFRKPKGVKKGTIVR